MNKPFRDLTPALCRSSNSSCDPLSAGNRDIGGRLTIRHVSTTVSSSCRALTICAGGDWPFGADAAIGHREPVSGGPCAARAPTSVLACLHEAKSPASKNGTQMNTYLLVHRHPENYIGSASTAAAWGTWFEQLGPGLVDLDSPVFERTPVGRCGAPLPLGGYTLVAASSFAEAVELANRCPIVQEGGGVEVGLLAAVPE